MTKFRPYSIVFGIIFIAQVYGEYTSNTSLIYITKPLITIVLMAGLYSATLLAGKFRKRIFAGLVFAFLGDVFLLFQAMNSVYFIFGLVSFLIGHLLYISAFQLDMRSNPGQKNVYFLPAGFVLSLFCVSFFLYLEPGLETLQVPVLVYSFVITLMVILSVGRLGKVNLYSFRLIALGAFLFLLSDCALAYNKFAVPLPNAGVLIMGSYMLAQYLIVCGTIVRSLTVTQTELK